ncbi:hypothetical protein KIN20_013677 [Parelaphostrongylus tenuis]|uniref:Sm domain-containing protein n=1 Tax=Parelaphostrongylus tenuis TaxID=148309 RepID=A0AAD5N2C4_PARTN|nr:hypothetical protein KIN20_013677 [Parelaphostrongylus tenuis]
MNKTHPSELKKYRIQKYRKKMDKEMDLNLNRNRRVSGVLRGFDPFTNMVKISVIKALEPSSNSRFGCCASPFNFVDFIDFSSL